MTSKLFAWLAPLALLLAAPAADAQVINELLIEIPGQDTTREYLEFRGPAGTVIPAGTYFVAVEGDRASNPGMIDAIVDLGGLSYGANGYLVILPFGNLYGPQVNPAASNIVSTATGFSGLPGGRWSATGGQTNFERPSASYFLIQAAVAPTLAFDIDTNDDGVPETNPETLWTVLDSIGGADHQLDMIYARINYRKAGTSPVGTSVITGFRPGYFGRNGDSVGSTAAAWVVSTQPTGTDPNWLLATTVPAGFTGKPLNHIGGTNIWGNVAPVNNLPAAQSTNEDVALVFSTLAGNAIGITDTDAAGGQMLVTLSVTNGTFSLSGIAGLTFSVGDGTADATMTFTGTVAAVNAALNGASYLPSPNYNGPASLTIDTNDQGNTGNTGALSDVDTLAITVIPVDDVPVANAQSVTTLEDTAVAITLTGSDVENAALTFALATPAANGTVVVNPDGSASYTPNLNFNGTDSFTFTVNDGTNTSAPATVSITVTPVDDVPTANPQSVGTLEDTAVAITLTGSDPEGSPLTFTVASAPANGVLSGTAPNLTYTPNANFSGTDSFTFTVSDGVNTSVAATVSITVTNVDNDPPTANAQSVTTPFQVPVNITLTGSDPEGTALTFTVATPPANGVLTGTAPNLTYTPNAGFDGADSFTFTVSDGVNTSAPATVSITVQPNPVTNTPPTAVNDAYTTAVNATLTVSAPGVLGNDTDPDAGTMLTAVLVAGPSGGTLNLASNGSFTYTPVAGFLGTVTFTYSANDGTVNSAAATVTITVGTDAIFKDSFENPPPPAAALAKVIPLGGAGSGIDTLDLERYDDALTAEAWAAVTLVDSTGEIVAAFELRHAASVEVRLALLDANGWTYGAWTAIPADALLTLRWLSLDGARVDHLGIDGEGRMAALNATK